MIRRTATNASVVPPARRSGSQSALVTFSTKQKETSLLLDYGFWAIPSTELHENSCELLLVLYAENALLHTALSGGGRSAPEEMREEHHDTDYQQHMNYTAGNVKGQESKQPKNN